MADRPPSEIARETLKQLAARRLAPTPDNYLAIYDEIAGIRSPQPFPEGPLSSIQRVLPGQTPAQKRLLGQFERAIITKDWRSLQSVMVGYANLGLHPATASKPIEVADAPTALGELPTEFAEAMARLIDNTLPALGDDDPRVIDMAQQLITFLREPAPLVTTAQRMLGNFSYRLSFATEEQASIRTSLLELLHMIFENIAVLSVDDRWLQGQAEALMSASTPPLTLRRLDDVQRRLKDVIFKQTEAKARSLEAQEQMKEMLATFIERLARITASSTSYQGTMERCADLIGKASTLQEIAGAAGGDERHPRHGAGQPRDARRTARPARAHRGQARRGRQTAGRTGPRQRPGAPRPADRQPQPQGPGRGRGTRNRPRPPPGLVAVPGTAGRGQLQDHQRPAGPRWR